MLKQIVTNKKFRTALDIVTAITDTIVFCMCTILGVISLMTGSYFLGILNLLVAASAILTIIFNVYYNHRITKKVLEEISDN